MGVIGSILLNYALDRSLDRYKARLVALGDRQEYDVDYEETFAHVAKMTTFCTIPAIDASRGWSL